MERINNEFSCTDTQYAIKNKRGVFFQFLVTLITVVLRTLWSNLKLLLVVISTDYST